MVCKVCNKKIGFWQLSIDKMCMSCYRKFKSAQKVQAAAQMQKRESTHDEEYTEKDEYRGNMYSVAANLLKLLGLILSALSFVTVIILGKGIYQFLGNVGFMTSGTLDSYYTLLMAILGIISLLPGVVVYGFGKIVEAAHVYVKNNRI